MCASSVKMDFLLNYKTCKWTQIRKHTRLIKVRGSGLGTDANM